MGKRTSGKRGSSLERFREDTRRRVREQGAVRFIIETLESGEIRELFARKQYFESLYLLGMLDYVSRMNGIPRCTDYNDLRGVRLKTAVKFTGRADRRRPIPEFRRFRILEKQVVDF